MGSRRYRRKRRGANKRNSVARKFLRRYRPKRSSHFSKLLDSKINTASEVASKRIALQEIAKQHPRRVFRQYLFGTYAIDTCIFGVGTPIQCEGKITAIAQVQKSDSPSSVKILPAVNPFQAPSPWVDPGINVVGALFNDGYRTGDSILVSAISLGIRYTIQDQGADNILSNATIYWGIYSCNYDGMAVTASAPSPDELLKIPMWGYTPALDINQAKAGEGIKKRTLASGKIICRTSLLNRTRERKYFIKLDKPVKVQYDTLDQNGQNVLRNKCFLVIRTSTPDHIAYIENAPIINAYTKVHYTSP